jgi:hypothetical protein
MQTRPTTLLTYSEIHQALVRYDKNKSIWHKLLLDKNEITILRSFARDDHNELTHYDLFQAVKVMIFLRKNAGYGKAEYELMVSLLCIRKIFNLVAGAEELERYNILTKDNFEAAVKHEKPCAVVGALFWLHNNEMLTLENRDLIKNHCHPNSLACFLVVFEKNNTHKDKYKNISLLPEDIEMIKLHPDPHEFYRALYFLHQANLFTPENRDVAKDHNAELLARVLGFMYEKRCLTQAFFYRIIKAAKPQCEADALISDLPRLKQETCHPYTNGAIQGLFSKVHPTFLPGLSDISSLTAQYISRSSAANIAKTCQAAASVAREQEERALCRQYKR